MGLGDHINIQMKRGVKIILCDPASKRIEAETRNGEVIAVNAYYHTPAFRWPKEGESWMVREENGSWYLDGLWENETPSPTVVQPGDLILSTTTNRILLNHEGKVHIFSPTGGGGTWEEVEEENLFAGSEVAEGSFNINQSIGVGKEVYKEAKAIGFGGTSQSIALGFQGFLQSEVEESVAIGFLIAQRGYYQQSILMGYTTGEEAKSNQDVIIGYGAGRRLNEGQTKESLTGQNLIFGYEGAARAEKFSQNVSLGYVASEGATDVRESIILGYAAGISLFEVEKSIIQGFAAGIGAAEIESSIFLGPEAGESAQKVSHSIFLGTRAGRGASGNNNIYLGKEVGKELTEEGKLRIGDTPEGSFVGDISTGILSCTAAGGEYGREAVTAFPQEIAAPQTTATNTILLSAEGEAGNLFVESRNPGVSFTVGTGSAMAAGFINWKVEG